MGWSFALGSARNEDISYHVFITILMPEQEISSLIRRRCSYNHLKTNGGSVCESNAPATSEMPPAGFEDREDHRTLCASGL
jgi:hypothetical protein